MHHDLFPPAGLLNHVQPAVPEGTPPMFEIEPEAWDQIPPDAPGENTLPPPEPPRHAANG